MPLTPVQWNERFTAQAGWTHDLRRYIFGEAHLDRAQRVLDVGSGTGALIDEISRLSQARVYALDINPANIGYAQINHPGAAFLRGDAHALPFASGSFDVCLCHFLLLWVKDASRVLAEMARLARPGGAVLALAEPDYGGRIDHPAELAVLGEWQQASLHLQGADPQIGRRLGDLFTQAGFTSIETGVLGGQWNKPITQEEIDAEWTVLKEDLRLLFTPDELEKMQVRLKQLYRLDLESSQRGDRLLFVPTFYAWGLKSL